MIVFDASLVVELLTNGPQADAIRRDLYSRDDAILAPHLIDIEVISALRGLAAAGRLQAKRVGGMLEELAALPAQRYSHLPLAGRIWELRHNFTAYDAAYIALAEVAGAKLYTCDGKLSKGHRADVVVFDGVTGQAARMPGS